MTAAANVVLDLDGTIVFPDPAEITIPGRSRATYLAASTAVLLESISKRCNLYVATARNAVSIAAMVRSLPAVRFAGFIVECGLVWRTNIHDPPIHSPVRYRFYENLIQSLPQWEFVDGYEQMICCIAPEHISHPADHAATIVTSFSPSVPWLVHQERLKTFFYPKQLCKVTGLANLGVGKVDFAGGDDFRYDYGLLAAASYPLALPSADEAIVQLVRARRGFVATSTVHAGATEMLEQISLLL